MNKFWLLLYLIPYGYITIICDISSGKISKNGLVQFIITTLGYISIFIPIFILKKYKNKFLGLFCIIFGNLINIFISILNILLFFDYEKYDYYFKPFGTIGLSVFLLIISLIFQMFIYGFINLPKNSKSDRGENILYLLYLFPIYTIINSNHIINYFFLLIPFFVILLYKYKNMKTLDSIFFIVTGNIVSLLTSTIFLLNIYYYTEVLKIVYVFSLFIILTILQIIVLRKFNKKG